MCDSVRGKCRTKAKNLLKSLAFLLVVIIWALNIWFYLGGPEKYLGMPDVVRFADALGTSYGEAPRILRPGDPAWTATVELIERYSNAKPSHERPWTFIGRFAAVDSNKLDIGGKTFQ